MRAYLLFICLLWYCTNCIFSQDIIPSGKIQTHIENLKKDPDMLHASWGFCVVRISDGKTLAAYNVHQSLIPASTLKVLTTAAALSILGTDYRYETKIEYDGMLDTITGILDGNIYIKGSGDPTLGSILFRNKNDTLVTEVWARTLKAKGIKKITGAVIGDAGIFEDDMLPSTWIWSDMGNYYGAGVCGLNFLDNKYTVYFNSGTHGSLTSVSNIYPEVPGMEFINNVISGGGGDNAFIYGSPYSYKRYAKGTVPENRKNYDVDGSLPDPSMLCAYMFNKALENYGIEVTGEPSTVKALKEKKLLSERERKIIFSHFSPTLDKLVYYTNLRSNNVYAETLLKTIAVKIGMTGTTITGTDVVKAFWKEKGVDIGGLNMADGSGLSRSNTVTVSLQVAILQKIYNEKFYEVFNNSLPVAGRSGSLSSLCKGTFAENNLRAKSGYITRARGYTGYVKNKKGEELAFSLIANNYECSPSEMKLKLEKLMELIPELE